MPSLYTIKGKTTDNFTRCEHYHSSLDIIAIKFKCCNEYYACFYCHQEEADHEAQVWGKDEFANKAILCGQCKNEQSISEYMSSSNKCPNCGVNFNPNCKKHYHLYFDI